MISRVLSEYHCYFMTIKILISRHWEVWQRALYLQSWTRLVSGFYEPGSRDLQTSTYRKHQTSMVSKSVCCFQMSERWNLLSRRTDTKMQVRGGRLYLPISNISIWGGQTQMGTPSTVLWNLWRHFEGDTVYLNVYLFHNKSSGAFKFRPYSTYIVHSTYSAVWLEWIISRLSNIS